MTNTQEAARRLTCIPFEGFYNSSYSEWIDSEESQWAEYEATERQAEQGVPPDLRLSAGELCELRWNKCADYKGIHNAIAKSYVDGFNRVFSEEIGFPLGLGFESMTSPRFYNFETDRIFCYIGNDVVQKLFDLSAADNHEHLAEQLKDNCTSYDGFRSFYSNDLAVWLDKPLEDWDHNELKLLLQACYILSGGDKGYRESVYEYVTSDTSDIDSGVDWEKLDGLIEEARQEKENELRADDPNYDAHPLPYRCTRTPDLFQSR